MGRQTRDALAGEPARLGDGDGGDRLGRVVRRAASHGDVVVLAVRGTADDDVLDLAGPETFAGKLVLDATNPLDFSGGAPPHLTVGGTDSLGERIQARLPEASVVKRFNTVSNAQMVDPDFEEGAPPVFVCGDDADANVRTEEILVELGWPGPSTSATSPRRAIWRRSFRCGSTSGRC